MRHVPFLKALATAKGANDPLWRDASAGFLVLRFFDRWLDEGPAVMASDPGLPALRARLRSTQDVEPHVRHLLLSAVNALVESESNDPAHVAGPLLAYASYLESAGRVALSAHVYLTIAHAMDTAGGPTDPASAAMTYAQHGYAARRVGDFESALASYDRAATIAKSVGDQALVLRAQIGIANVSKARGDLPAAETLLDRVILEVDTTLSAKSFDPGAGEALSQVSCVARRSRGAVRQDRGRYTEAIQDYFAAMRIAYDRTQYEIVLGDLAACASEVGYHQTARNAHTVLARTAHSPMVRASSLINLLELVVRDGDRAEFIRVRDTLANFASTYAGMPSEYTAHAALYEAYGTERFESYEDALSTYREVAAKARSLEIFQVEHLAEERIAALLAAGRTPEAAPIPPEVDVPETLQPVADAIAELLTAAPAETS